VGLSDKEVLCSDQSEGISENGNNYSFQKSCHVPMPGVPNRNIFYRLDISLNLTLTKINGKNVSSGSLVCVANNDGFHGLELSECK